MRFIQRLSYALLTLTLLTCVSAADEGEEEPEFIVGEANITSIRVEDGSIIVEGTLPDGCTSISTVEQQIDGNMLIITVSTERPADLMCTQAIVNFEQEIPLNIENIPDGEYEVVINGITAENRFDPQIVITCPLPDADYDVYTDDLNGLCFRFPSGYRIAAADGQTTITAGVDSDLNPLPFLAIEFIDLETPLETFIKEGFNDIFFEETALDGGTLYETILLVGPNLSRIGFIAANNSVLRLVNRPVEGGSDEAITASENLWTAVTHTMLFFQPDPESDAEPTRSTFLEANHLNITIPVNWQISHQDDITEFMPIESAETWLTLQPLPDFPEVDTPDALLITAANLIEVDVSTFEALQNDTTKGIVAFPGPEPACQTIFIWHDMGVNRMDVSSAACDSDGIRDPVVEQIIKAIQVVTTEK